MPIKQDFEKLEAAHRRFIVAYTILTEKKIKSKSAEARKALMEMINISKDLRKSVQAFKDKI